MRTIFWQALETFNLFRLLENDIMELFSIGVRKESKHEFAEREVYKVWKVKECFINTKIAIFGVNLRIWENTDQKKVCILTLFQALFLFHVSQYLFQNN